MTLQPDKIVQIMLRARLRIAAIATAILRDAHLADDIFQQVVLAALERPQDFQDQQHVLNWAIRAARFRAIDAARQRKIWTLPDAILDRLEARWASSEVQESDLAEQARVLHHCLNKLSSSERSLLHLRYEEGLTVVAISSRLGRTLNGLYQSLSRIHRALRKCVHRELVAVTINPTCETNQ